MKIRIVLVMMDNLSSYAEYLKKQKGVEVIEASNGDECLQHLRKKAFDVCLSEVLIEAPKTENASRYIGGGDALYIELRQRGFEGPIILWGGEELVDEGVLGSIGDDSLAAVYDIEDREVCTPTAVVNTIRRLLDLATDTD